MTKLNKELHKYDMECCNVKVKCNIKMDVKGINQF